MDAVRPLALGSSLRVSFFSLALEGSARGAAVEGSAHGALPEATLRVLGICALSPLRGAPRRHEAFEGWSTLELQGPAERASVGQKPAAREKASAARRHDAARRRARRAARAAASAKHPLAANDTACAGPGGMAETALREPIARRHRALARRTALPAADVTRSWVLSL